MGVTNRGRYSNPAFDKVLSDALVTIDEKKREGLIQQAAEIVMGDVALIRCITKSLRGRLALA